MNTGVKKLQTIKDNSKVLIVTSLGNEFLLQHIGFTIFSNDYNNISVEEWDIDSIIENKVAKLKFIDKFDVVNEDLTEIKKDMEVLTKSFWTDGVVFKGFDDKIFPYAKNNNYDLILFINSYETEDPVFYTGLHLEGFGLYKRKVLGEITSKYYAMISSSIYDVNTRKKIAGSSRTRDAYISKYNQSKGVESISYDDITEDKDVIISLIMNSLYTQFNTLEIMKKINYF